jgi:hypothetical protein
MAGDDELRGNSLRFMREIHRLQEAGEPLKKYIIGGNLGLDPNETQSIVDSLKKDGLITEEDTPIEEVHDRNPDFTILEITSKGQLAVTNAK